MDFNKALASIIKVRARVKISTIFDIILLVKTGGKDIDIQTGDLVSCKIFHLWMYLNLGKFYF